MDNETCVCVLDKPFDFENYPQFEKLYNDFKGKRVEITFRNIERK